MFTGYLSSHAGLSSGGGGGGARAAWARLPAAGRATTTRSRRRSSSSSTRSAAHDYRTLCDQVLGPRLLARLAAGGIGCEQAMAISLGRVRAPILSIGRITVSGSTAQAITLQRRRRSAAARSRRSASSKTGHGWRVVVARYADARRPSRR